jgi:hypothetical protein
MYHTAIPSAIPNGWHLEEEEEGGGEEEFRGAWVSGVPPTLAWFHHTSSFCDGKLYNRSWSDLW